MDKPTIPLYQVIDSLGTATGDVSGLASESSETKKETVTKQLTGVDVDNIKTFGTGGIDKDSGVPVKDAVAQYQNNIGVIDGDFNFWSGYSSPVASSGYFSDMWRIDFSGATGTASRQSHINGSKPYYARVDITTGNDAVRIYERIKGSYLSGQKISFFMRTKYVSNASTGVSVQIRPDGGSSISTTLIDGFTTSWSWIRVDIEVPNYTATSYTELRLNNQPSEIFDLDIDKIRIVPTGSLQAGEIPSWLDNDEDDQKQKRDAIEYNRKVGAAPDRKIRMTDYGPNDLIFWIPYYMIRQPSLSGTADTVGGDGYAIANLSGGQVTGFTYSVQNYGDSGFEIKAAKTAHGLTDARLLFYGNSGFDARY